MNSLALHLKYDVRRVKLPNKKLVGKKLWNRLVARIVRDHDVDEDIAERIMDQALGFLSLAAKQPKGRYSPSPLVDIGWHTFILYTREYAAFCDKIAGRFIHHAPNDDPDKTVTNLDPLRTMKAMEAAGISVDKKLWKSASDLATCRSVRRGSGGCEDDGCGCH